jgi:DNA-binding transcriptional ArsR family regulator
MEHITRNELYELVWSKPATEVAKSFSTSTTTLREICKALNVPQPDRGYWAKKQWGKPVTQIPLPENRPGLPIGYTPADEKHWSRPHYTYAPRTVESAIPIADPKFPSSMKEHQLLQYARDVLSNCARTDDWGYFRNRNPEIPYLLVGEMGLDSAIEFANKLFVAFEKAGCPVRIALPYGYFSRHHQDLPISDNTRRKDPYEVSRTGWITRRDTLIWVGCMPFIVAIFERCSEQRVYRINSRTYLKGTEPKRKSPYDYGYTTTDLFTNGMLGVSINAAINLRRPWTLVRIEDKKSTLSKHIPEIIQAVIGNAPSIIQQHLEFEEEERIERERREAEYRIYEEQQRIRKEQERIARNIKRARESLDTLITEWTRAENINLFFDKLESEINQLRDPKKTKYKNKLKEARKLIGSRDPMMYFKQWVPPSKR